MSLNPSNLSSSNLSSNKLVNSSSSPPFSLHAPVVSLIFLSHSQRKGEEIGVKNGGVVVGDFEEALTSNGFLKIQEQGGVDLPKMRSVLPVSVEDWPWNRVVEHLCCNQGVRSKDFGDCLSLLRGWIVGLD